MQNAASYHLRRVCNCEPITSALIPCSLLVANVDVNDYLCCFLIVWETVIREESSPIILSQGSWNRHRGFSGLVLSVAGRCLWWVTESWIDRAPEPGEKLIYFVCFHCVFIFNFFLNLLVTTDAEGNSHGCSSFNSISAYGIYLCGRGWDVSLGKPLYRDSFLPH